jgi:lipopolysaccharide transport system permease protein
VVAESAPAVRTKDAPARSPVHRPSRRPLSTGLKRYPANPGEVPAGFWRHRELILQLAKRDVIGRYRGSALGIFWSLAQPLLMLAIYTLVFGVIFKARWNGAGESRAEFALVLFAGLLVFNIFAECVGRAPRLILDNTNYVKKVVFPLEVLPWVPMASSLFHAAVNFAVWLVFYFFVLGVPPPTILLLPIIVVDMVLLTMGVSWFLASLGVYVRDIAPLIGIVISALMFLTPIFYPVSAIPKDYLFLFYANPLTFVIEQTRDLLLWGTMPALWPSLWFLVLCGGIAWLGFAWFQKTRRGFADVL